MPGEKTQINGLDIQWINHATVKIKSSNLVLYIDPWSKVLKGNEEKADIILISHSHYDHFDLGAIQNLAKENTEIVSDEISAEKLKDYNVKSLRSGERVEIKGIKIWGVPAYNRVKSFHPKGTALGFVIDFEGKKLYFASDTDVIPEMSNLDDIEVAFLPIGGTYTMNQEEAVEAARIIDPKIVIPIHFNFIEGTEADPYKFKKELEEISGIRVILL